MLKDSGVRSPNTSHCSKVVALTYCFLRPLRILNPCVNKEEDQLTTLHYRSVRYKIPLSGTKQKEFAKPTKLTKPKTSTTLPIAIPPELSGPPLHLER